MGPGMLDETKHADDQSISKEIDYDPAPKRGADKAPPPKRGIVAYRRQLIVAVGSCVLVIAGYFAYSWWTVGRFMISTDDAYVGARAATLSPKIPGYILSVHVTDNATVKAGDLLAEIDRGDYELAVTAARDQCDTQRAVIVRIGKQLIAQNSAVDQARAQAQSAKAASVKAAVDLKRQQDLAERKINSVAALDQAVATNDQAKAAVAAAEASIASAIANVGVLEAQQGEAASLLKQYETALEKALRDLSFTEIRAPFDGVVGNRAIQVGDYVQPAQRLASLVPLQAVYIDANFKETQLSRIKSGQRVKVTVDAQPDTVIEGQVVSVAPASGSVFSLLPPDNATGNFTKVVQRVPVRIALPASTESQTILRSGMSVVVSVNTKPGTEKAEPILQPTITLTKRER